MKKAPERVRGLPHFLAGSVCTDQAVAVRNFLIAISSFARNQSSRSWPSSPPLASYSSYARRRIWSSCGSFIAVGGFLGDWNSLGVLLEAKVRRVKDWSQLPKIGAVLMPVLGMRVDSLPVRA